MDFKVEFGKRLQNLRLEKGLSQTDLSKDLGIKKSTLGNYEQGYREPREYEFITKLSKYFNVTADFLLGLTEERTETQNEFDLKEIYESDDFNINGRPLSNDEKEKIKKYLNELSNSENRATNNSK